MKTNKILTFVAIGAAILLIIISITQALAGG